MSTDLTPTHDSYAYPSKPMKSADHYHDQLVEALALLNELSLLWHGDAVARCSNGEGVTDLKFNLLMERVEVFTFPYRRPA